MRKLFSHLLGIILIAVVFTACQTNPASKNTAATAPENPTPNQTAASTKADEIKNTTATIGNVTVSGPIDVSTFGQTAPSTPAVIVNEKGLLLSNDGFVPASLSIQKTDSLLIFNSTDHAVKLKVQKSGKESCSALGNEIDLLASGNQKFQFTAPTACTISDGTHSASLTVQ